MGRDRNISPLIFVLRRKRIVGNKDILDYIHFQRQNFLKARTLIGEEIDITSLSAAIHEQYKMIAEKAKKRQSELQSLTPVASDLLSLFATSNNINELISNSNIDNDVYNSISFDQELRDMSIALSKFSSETKDVDNQIERLSKLLSDMDSILNHLNVINEELLEYCAKLPEHQQESVNASFNSGGLHILNINPTAISSLKSLQGRLEALKTVQSSSTSGHFPNSVTYTNSKGEQSQTSVFGLVYTLRQLIINILGGYGEAVSAIYAMSKADELIQQAFGRNPNIIIEGSGTQKLKNGQTAKSDVQLKYSEDNVNLTIGVSAKAQLLKSSKTITTFQTSKLEVFLRGINKNLEYSFLNNLYHGRTSINEQMILNRYIAAMNFDNAVTGWDLGDKVLFLSYLDKVISVADFYDAIINKGKTKISNYPAISIPGINKKLVQFNGSPDNTIIDEIEDTTPLDKSSVAWERSDKVKQIMMNLHAQIHYAH